MCAIRVYLQAGRREWSWPRRVVKVCYPANCSRGLRVGGNSADLSALPDGDCWAKHLNPIMASVVADFLGQLLDFCLFKNLLYWYRFFLSLWRQKNLSRAPLEIHHFCAWLANSNKLLWGSPVYARARLGIVPCTSSVCHCLELCEHPGSVHFNSK